MTIVRAERSPTRTRAIGATETTFSAAGMPQSEETGGKSGTLRTKLEEADL